MSKNSKKVISVTLEPDVIESLDKYAYRFSFSRSNALNFILKNILSDCGSSEIFNDMFKRYMAENRG